MSEGNPPEGVPGQGVVPGAKAEVTGGATGEGTGASREDLIMANAEMKLRGYGQKHVSELEESLLKH